MAAQPQDPAKPEQDPAKPEQDPPADTMYLAALKRGEDPTETALAETVRQHPGLTIEDARAMARYFGF